MTVEINPSLSNLPGATARLQVHKDFTLEDAAAQVPYFKQLGITHLYVSPILTARAGSQHGYDVVDHSVVNSELGGEAALRALVACLRRHGMGLIVDIVPNHMAVGRGDNAWWLDVLEWGRDSHYSGFFDIDWDVPDPLLHNRVLAPFLGKPYGEALADGEIELRFDTASGKFSAMYFDHHFPIAPSDYGPLLRANGDALGSLAKLFREATSRHGSRSSRREAFAQACKALAAANAEDGAVRDAVALLLQRMSPKTEASRLHLHRLLERQHYRLSWWRTAPDEINWRRFFDVIDLAGLRIQDNAVFEAVHATTFRLFAEGLIDGLRVDHVDGLADPRAYCRKLRARLQTLASTRPAELPRGASYLIVEKILAPGELLARDWRTDGTSGYVFMNEAGALLHDPAGEAPLTQLWAERSGSSGDFEDEERRARRRIPQELLAADFNACAHALHAIARSAPATRDWSLGAVRRVLTELLVHFPVYRTYADARGRSAADAEIMRKVVAETLLTCRPGERALVELIDRWLGGEAPQQAHGAAAVRMRLRALARFQQLTSPVAAKSVEDTAFYRHGRLLSRNEVGANPGQFSLSVADFHQLCGERLKRYPLAMLATATHDHKRGEDLRARLAVLSEIPQEWAIAARRWSELNTDLKPEQDGIKGPDATDEYILYQMLVGAWPLTQQADDAAGLKNLCERLAAWQEKAVREAKRRSGWIEPNLAYERACTEFLQALLDPARSSQFLQELQAFGANIAAAGAVNGLTQTLLRTTTPGVPDLYQGTEFWDFSLVDPDNRRPVDFAARSAALAETKALPELIQHWHDGRIKQRLLARMLDARVRNPELFSHGEYRPLVVRGSCAANVIAFVRKYGDQSMLVATILYPYKLLGESTTPAIEVEHWGDTQLLIPASLGRQRWRNILTEQAIETPAAELRIADLFKDLPMAVLMAT